ncbi:hypothetical protein ACTA71_007356 [Dictyostelium dimigraforme]
MHHGRNSLEERELKTINEEICGNYKKSNVTTLDLWILYHFKFCSYLHNANVRFGTCGYYQIKVKEEDDQYKITHIGKVLNIQLCSLDLTKTPGTFSRFIYEVVLKRSFQLNLLFGFHHYISNGIAYYSNDSFGIKLLDKKELASFLGFSNYFKIQKNDSNRTTIRKKKKKLKQVNDLLKGHVLAFPRNTNDDVVGLVLGNRVLLSHIIRN